MTPFTREVLRRSREALEHNARRTGVSRRDFLVSSAGAATMLAVLAACSDDANRSQGQGSGGTFSVPPDATTDPELADETLSGDGFVFDVQGHFLDYPEGYDGATPAFPQSDCGGSPRDCYSSATFLDLMFDQSDTSMVMLSAVPFPGDLLSPEVMAAAIDRADELCGDGRVLMQGHATPSVVGAGGDRRGDGGDRRRLPDLGLEGSTPTAGDPDGGWTTTTRPRRRSGRRSCDRPSPSTCRSSPCTRASARAASSATPGMSAPRRRPTPM